MWGHTEDESRPDVRCGGPHRLHGRRGYIGDRWVLVEVAPRRAVMLGASNNSLRFQVALARGIVLAKKGSNRTPGAKVMDETRAHSTTPRRMPGVAAIVKHWQAQGAPIAVDWSEAHDHCWRCGCDLVRGFSAKHSEDDAFPHRAHIVPRSLGGSDTADNLIILCRRCHLQAPDVADKDFMWEWIRKTWLSCDRHFQTVSDGSLDMRGFSASFLCQKWSGVLRLILTTRCSVIRKVNCRRTKRRRLSTVFAGPFAMFTRQHAGSWSPATFAWAIRQCVLFAEGGPTHI